MRSLFQEDREAAQRWARALLARSDWAVLDTETTGLGATAEVVQISVVDPRGATLLDTLIRPSVPIPPEVISVHGITDAMVANAPTYREVHPRLREVVSGRLIIAYNAAFDRRILYQTALRHETGALSVAWECAMEQYARFVGQRSSRHGHYTWQPLPRPPEYRQARHQVIVDCLATLDVIRRMAGT